jgi:hypothetical protein
MGEEDISIFDSLEGCIGNGILNLNRALRHRLQAVQGRRCQLPQLWDTYTPTHLRVS